MNRICVYTCITGDYDDLHDVEVTDKDVDFICFTNNKNIKSDTWKIIYVDNDGLNDKDLSRKIKMLGEDSINKKYDILLWQDASVIWNTKPSMFVKKYLHKSFAAFKHSYRDCAYSECSMIIRARKETKANVEKTIKFLKSEKFPEHYGLCEMTVFIRKTKDEKVNKTMDLWFQTYMKYSKRDQLSIMYSIWKNKLDFDLIDSNVWNNEYFRCVSHNYQKETKNARVYYADSSVDPNSYDYTLDF